MGQLPIYYNHKNTGRPTLHPDGLVFWSHYTDEENTPLYPFGYGLSYTTFEYSDVKLDSEEMGYDGSVSASVTVKNTGSRAGIETVQLYIRDLVGSTTRPVKELKGFERVELEPGASKTVTFKITTKDLTFFTRDRKWTAEPGDFHVFVGTDSHKVSKPKKFTLKK